MTTYARLLALLLLVSLIPIQETTAQEERTQVAALLDLQERGFVRGNAIYAEDFIDQIKAGNLEGVELYLAAGMRPDVRDIRDVDNRRTALLVAAEHGHAEIVEALVEAGADVGVKDKTGRTPLVVAVMNEQDAVVQVLLDRQQN